MTQTQIQCFILVADCLSISRAAKQMYISQPSVSKHISLLEEEFGFKLFTRQNNKLQLTKQGRIMYEFFKRSATDYNRTIKRALEVSLDEKPIHIGCIENCDISYFYPTLERALKNVGISSGITIDGYSFDGLKAGLLNNDIALSIALCKNFEGIRDISFEKLSTIGGKIVVSMNNPLLEKDDFQISDLKDQVIYSTQGLDDRRNNMISFIYDKLCQYGFTPDMKKASSISSIYVKLQNGNGAMVVGEWITPPANMRCLPCPSDFRFDIGLAWNNRYPDPTRDKLIDSILKCYYRK